MIYDTTSFAFNSGNEIAAKGRKSYVHCWKQKRYETGEVKFVKRQAELNSLQLNAMFKCDIRRISSFSRYCMPRLSQIKDP